MGFKGTRCTNCNGLGEIGKMGIGKFSCPECKGTGRVYE